MPQGVGATPLCTNHACDYACPGAQIKCADPNTGAPSCCAPACNPGGTPPTVFCSVGGAPATCVTEGPAACGTACAVCGAPADASPVCDPTLHACDFACNAGFFKHNGACVSLAAGGAFGQATVALGGRHSCAILADGGVVCWGANDQGQLGAGTRPVVPGHPIDVVLPGNAAALTAGDAHTCAALTDGTVYCWGANTKGQLGQPLSATAPVLVPGLGSVAGIGRVLAAGVNHTCAISGGAVICWGDNALGQLGTGTAGAPTSTPTPTLITTGAKDIAAGGDHTCAIVPAGVVRCWGANDFGQLGKGVPVPPAPTFQATPTTIVLTGKDPAGQPLGTGALSIAAGRQHTCVISSGEGGVCWGRELELQIAARNMTTQGVPYNADKISTKNSRLVAAGGLHSCTSVPTDLAPKCAGDAGTGQAPVVGTAGTCPVDLATPAGLMVFELFGGGNHNCVIVEPITPPPALPVPGVGPFSLYCWGVNDAGQLGNGATLATTTAVLQVVVGQ
jgi:alpha-tubulin suppressor-like RCC1 family protein